MQWKLISTKLTCRINLYIRKRKREREITFTFIYILRNIYFTNKFTSIIQLFVIVCRV